MDDRRWILYVLGVTMLVPFLLEGWTFYSLIRNSVTGSGGPPTETSAEHRYYGEGDEILPLTEARETLRDLRLTGEAKRWMFHLLVEVENGTAEPYELRLVEVILQNGERITSDCAVRIEPDSSGRLEARVTIPAGTSPRSLRVATDAGSEQEPSVKEVHLSSVPVRKTDGDFGE